ncbi:Glu-tRNA(Gln) amidotransferase subunit GatE [Candidatus Woesearchaeota archaeon]|nr:Glu-tRNA(Gln) amidotransferase subunit GatE [Candidatus Woesearchaeota archaeon]
MDYQSLGFKCGLEIHQQLDTNKLFCNCQSFFEENKVDYEIKRKLKASAGELGDVDIAALHETLKNKAFIYQVNRETACLIELDDEPIHELNKEALKVVLQVAMVLNAKIIDELQVMRKVVVDGSNVSGFQRSALVAVNGFLDTSKGRVGIETICIEEESAKKIKEDEKTVTYNLSRLGIPLIEIATDASIKDPEHAKEVAEQLGMILRSTGKVKRGIGTIRQDVNVSIKGHPRVELKGFQDLRSIPKVIEQEIKRQQENIKNKKLHHEVRKVNPDFTSTFLRPMPGSSRMYPETDLVPIKISKNLLSEIKIPELITEKAVNIEKKYNLSPQMSREILKLNIPFDYYAEKYKLNPSIIAEILVEIPKELKARFNINTEKLTKDNFEFIFENLQSKKINREAAKDVLKELAEGKHIDLNNFKQIDNKEIEEKLKEIISKNKGAHFSALMGEAMKIFRGKSDGKTISDLLKKLVKN